MRSLASAIEWKAKVNALENRKAKKKKSAVFKKNKLKADKLNSAKVNQLRTDMRIKKAQEDRARRIKIVEEMQNQAMKGLMK